MLYVPALSPDTLTVLGCALPVSRYPLIIRKLPAWSVILVFQTLSETHVAVAVVPVPVSSTRTSGELLLAPVAVFQLFLAITPAVSRIPIGVVLLPTKSML